MTATIKLDKTESKLAQFVQRAQYSGKDNRPILNGVNVNGSIVATDGHRLHAVKSSDIPDVGKMEGLTVDLGKVRAGENLLEPSVIEGNYPAVSQMIPTDDPDMVVAIDPSYLVDALKTMDKHTPVYLVFRRAEPPYTYQPVEIHGKIEGSEAYALVMPMQPDMDKEQWKPGS